MATSRGKEIDMQTPSRLVMLPLVCLLAGLSLALAVPGVAGAATFPCRAGDVPCLIAAIRAANANGEPNTIEVAAGTYPLTVVDNTTEGANGLPVITSTLTLRGAGADTTILERRATAPPFRLLHVAATGTLTLQQLTLLGGLDEDGGMGGGAVANRGTLILAQTHVVSNDAVSGGGITNNSGIVSVTDATFRENMGDGGGAIQNFQGRVAITQSRFIDNVSTHEGGGFANYGGMVTLTRSTITGSQAHGPAGISNINGTVLITDATITHNRGDQFNGIGLGNLGVMTILNSTIAHNDGGGITGILNGGQLLVGSSTIAENVSTVPFVAGVGLFTTATGATTIHNTIIAHNGADSDCHGAVTSLGGNLIGDPSGCTITLQASDRTGDPGLGTFTDTGSPGQGYLPLLPGSQAIDAGTMEGCPPLDQLGQPRTPPCDIGAIEFQRAPSPAPAPMVVTPAPPPPPAPAPPPTPVASPAPAPAPAAPPTVAAPTVAPAAPAIPTVVTLRHRVQGDFDGDGALDHAGLDEAGGIWVCLSWYPQCQQIYGRLDQVVAGDFDGNGRDDLAGIADTHIWIMLDGQVWQQIPGWLDTIVAGDFNGDGQTDLAGLAATRIWQTTQVPQVVTGRAGWTPLPGWLETLASVPLSAIQQSLAGSNGTDCWRLVPPAAWTWEPCRGTMRRVQRSP